MNYSQDNRPLKLNMDKSPKSLEPVEAFFLLNHDRFLNRNGDKRGTLGKGSPMAANYLACEMDQPAGENYSQGDYYSILTNELYSWVYNSNGIHYIQRINGDGICEIVYMGCLQLSAEPRHKITQWRAYLRVEKLCANRHGKTLIFVDGFNEDIGAIDVEASIATDFFTTPFFEDSCSDPCDFIKLCVPQPCGCLKGEFVPLDPNDIGKSNNVTDAGFKFAFRHVYYDGRGGEWSEPSTLFYQDTRGCFETTEGLPRCIRLRVPVGNALVDKIEIAYYRDGAWFKSDTIDKYKKYNSTQEFWFDRGLAELPNYSDEDCSFDYQFCNDKQCDTIDINEFNRVYNPMPRQPQGLFPIGLSNLEDIALAVFNYKEGNCPLDKTEVEKFDITLDCPTNNCDTKFTKITTYILVHNRTHQRNQPIFRLGGTAANTPDDATDTAYFGGLNQRGSGSLELGHGQNFNDKTRNFIAYLEGTDYWDEAKQWKADPGFVNKEEWGVLAHLEDDFEKRRWRRAISDGQYFYQKIELKVPKGTRGFLRLSSHQSTGNNQDTSTFVAGIFNDITQYGGNIAIHNGNTDFSTEEIFVDTCGYDELEIKKAFLIEDNAVDAGLTDRASSYHGYIKDGNNQPVEGAVIYYDGQEVITDHNGFYHFYRWPGSNDTIAAEVRVEQDCSSFTKISDLSITGELGVGTRADLTIDNDTYKDGFFAVVKPKVEDCDGNPVPGVRVALSGSKYKISGADGYAVFKIRNYQSRHRNLRAILLNRGGCFTVDCNGDCNPCMPIATATAPACFNTEPEIPMTSFVLDVASLNENSRGLKAGGLYDFGFVVRGGCGKISAVNQIKSLYIPRTQEKGQQNFCSFLFNGNGIVLPDWADCVDIVRSENLNPFELQWVVDEIERTDDGKIILTIQSLNDYNEKYFFKTNTIYKWLKNDRVEFIRNGDGKIFTLAEHGLLNYQTLSPFHDEQVSGLTEAEADFFNQLIITDDGKLDGLTEGALIELHRPKVCTTAPVYYGICVSIPVINGRLAAETGTFLTFDTYFVNRTISSLASQRFEHHNPSDFWGDSIVRLDDRGKAYFENKFENEQRFGRNISIGEAIEFNRFGNIVKRFDPAIHGDIIAMWITDNKIGLCISEHDNSLFEVGDDLLKVGTDGIVRVASGDQILSDSQPKLYGAYGCQYDSIGSILFGDGWATWADVNRHHYIKHNYREAVAVDIGRCERFFRRKLQELETYNRKQTDPLNKRRFATGLNWQSDSVYLTIKSLRDSGFNNEAGPFLKPNETIAFDPATDDFLTHCSFTPEGYGRLSLFDGEGCMFVTYLNGLPYIHPIITTKWNEFFGVACDWMVGIVLNKGQDKLKRPLSIEVQSDTMFFVKEVTTEKINFKSEIPAKRWTQNQNKWNAAFLSNINSRDGLYGEQGPDGYYAEVLFVRDNTDGLRYNTIDNAKRIAYSELDYIFFKFAVKESSGFTANV